MTVIWASLHFAICIHLVVVCTLHHVVYTSPFYILQHILHFAPFSCNLTSSLSVLHFALCIISLHLQVFHFTKHSAVCSSFGCSMHFASCVYTYCILYFTIHYGILHHFLAILQYTSALSVLHYASFYTYGFFILQYVLKYASSLQFCS